MLRHPLCLLLVLPAIARAAPPAKPLPCFDATSTQNSAGTQRVFRKHALQGGGPTWAGLLEAAIHKLAVVGSEAPANLPGLPGFGAPRLATFQGAKSWYLVDDEADAARVCAGTPALLAAIRAEYDRLNRDPKALEAALATVPAEERE